MARKVDSVSREGKAITKQRVAKSKAKGGTQRKEMNFDGIIDKVVEQRAEEEANQFIQIEKNPIYFGSITQYTDEGQDCNLNFKPNSEKKMKKKNIAASTVCAAN